MNDTIEEILSSCTLCPRSCGVNRFLGQKGFCREDARIFVARAALHMWEEPCISGEEGSGTVFFSGCSLGCIFCQNREISEGQTGKEVSIERLAEIFLELQEKNANNINLVTAGHYVPQVALALEKAKRNGLQIPIVYNSSAYETVETLQMLEHLVDIYLPDFKYMDPEIAKEYAHAENYSEIAKKAIAEMVCQTKEASFDERGIMKSGVIVRHLMLPGHLRDSKRIVRYLYETYGDQIYISMMNQYTPMEHLKTHPKLGRTIRKKEYDALLDYAIELGIENGFFQEGETAKESFIPSFDCEGV